MHTYRHENVEIASARGSCLRIYLQALLMPATEGLQEVLNRACFECRLDLSIASTRDEVSVKN